MENSEGHIKAIIATGYYTGMRKGEILGLTWDKIDFTNRMIRLEVADTKDRQARNVPICTELFEMLHKMPNKLHTGDGDNHVFQFQGNPVKDIRVALRRACKFSGIVYGRKEKGGFVFHDLMFDRYNSIDEGDAHDAMVQFEGYFSNVDHPVDQVDN